MTTRQQHRLGLSSLLILGLAFIAAVMASNTLLSGWRLDLTENRLYTIAPGTERLLSNIPEPINLYFFFSDQASRDVPALRSYANRVRELLEEFVAEADGRLILHVVDPVPFSEEEDRATQFGLQAINLGALAETMYFGLAATNSIGEQAVIEVFDPSKESFLEYDLAKLIYSLANAEKNVVGLLADISMGAGFNPQTQQMTQPWTITNQARQVFEIRNLPTSLERIDEDVNVLWIVHPKALDDTTLYAIDQFILRGGRALIFVDPLAEIDTAAAGPSGMGAGSSSSLQALFDAWGVEFSEGQIVADNVYALSINAGPGRRPVRHLGLLGIDASSMNQEDVVTGGLGTVNFGTAGHFSAREDAGVTFTPLITSSTQAAPLEVQRFQFLPEPEALLDDFAPTGETYVLAGRLDGRLATAFPEGPPPAPAGAETEEQPEEALTAHLTSIDRAGVIVVGDVDVLSDRLWVQQLRGLFGQGVLTAFANNGDFVLNALDNLSGSADLIGIRSRASFLRPFTTVEALRREADTRFRQTEQRLQAELAETERNLSELQAARGDDTSVLMTPEQQAEIERFLAQQVRIRGELRAVRRNLDRDIEQLGTALKIINIGLVPVLLTVIALIVVALKRSRKGAKR